MFRQEKVEEFLKELEKFVDLRYRINRETDLCNQSFVVKNLLPDYENSKKTLEISIKKLLD